MKPADFYTGIVVDAYAKLKSAHFDPEPYVRFVTTTGEPALEIGCGDGDPLLDLRRRGLDVDGLDSSGDMLDRCRSRAAALGIDVTLHLAKMEEMSLPHRYRSIYLAGPTFNLLPDDETALGSLRAIRAHLADDGAALIPLWIPGPTPADELGVAREAAEPDGTVLRYTAISEVYDTSTRTRITTSRYERITPVGIESADREWLLHWYTVDGFRALCAEAGLSIAGIVDDDGHPAPATATGFTVTVRRD